MLDYLGSMFQRRPWAGAGQTGGGMGDLVQAGFGLVILAGFWWGVFALIRLFEPPAQTARPGNSLSAPAPRLGSPSAYPVGRATAARRNHCCPDCTPSCQTSGLVMGQVWGRGDGWWGQPFGDDGPNTEAMVFWGDGCCPDCAECTICQGG